MRRGKGVDRRSLAVERGMEQEEKEISILL